LSGKRAQLAAFGHESKTTVTGRPTGKLVPSFSRSRMILATSGLRLSLPAMKSVRLLITGFINSTWA
jgi:hypothetical protein